MMQTTGGTKMTQETKKEIVVCPFCNNSGVVFFDRFTNSATICDCAMGEGVKTLFMTLTGMFKEYFDQMEESK
jgi:hypothetical protein